MKTWIALAGAVALTGSLVTAGPATAAPEAAGSPAAYHQFTLKVAGITSEKVVTALDPMPAGSYVVTFSTVIQAKAKKSGTFRCQVYTARSGGTAVINSTPVTLAAGASVPFAVTVPVVLDTQAAIVTRCKASGKGLSVTAWRSDLTAVTMSEIVDF